MLIADTNEFHPLVDGPAYAAGHASDGSPYSVIILRATYSNSHVDNAFHSSLTQARDAGLKVGFYGYMVASVDAASQGTFFGQTVKNAGGLQAGDAIWCDCEEGTGDQTPRVEAFLAAAHGVLNDNLVDEGAYSGAYFWSAHLVTLPNNVHRWIAAYGTGTRPAGADLWQFTDNQSMPGVSGNCDCSIFNGTLEQYLALVGSSQPTPPTPTPTPPPPAPTPPKPHNPYTPLAVDGVPDLAQAVPTKVFQTIKALQWVCFHGNTADCDGKFGTASHKALQAHLGVTQDGVIGPVTVRALQKRVGAAQDGNWGPMTTKALQAALNKGTF